MPFYKDYKDHLNFDGFKTHVVGTKIRLVLFPRKCHFTGKWLWMEKAYQQVAMWTGPGDPVFEERWYDKKEFLIARIKGEI